MKKNIGKKISDVLFYLALAIGGYGIIRTIISYMNTPEGVCPITNYRPYIVSAIILSLLSMIISWIYEHRR